MLKHHDLPANFNGRPNEIDAIPFADDTTPREYDRNWRRGLGKRWRRCFPRSSVSGPALPARRARSFLVGQLRSSVSLFSGREAPQHPGGMPGLPDRITREAYSREVSSGGFWAGGVTPAEPFFYSYIYRSRPATGRPRSRTAASTRPSASSFCPMRMCAAPPTLSACSPTFSGRLRNCSEPGEMGSRGARAGACCPLARHERVRRNRLPVLLDREHPSGRRRRSIRRIAAAGRSRTRVPPESPASSQ